MVREAIFNQLTVSYKKWMTFNLLIDLSKLMLDQD